MARVLAAGILAGASIVFSGSVVAAPGDPDPTFGAGGQVVLKRGGTLFENEGFALQADGKLLVPYEGRGLNGGQASGLVRYNANGTVDTAFGIQGQAPSNGVTVAASGGMIFVTARRPDGGGTFDYVGVSRFTSAGVLDAAFGVNGSTPQFMASAPLGTGDTQHLTSIAVAPDGKIVAAGVARNADNFFEVLVVRFNTDGTLDTGFGTGGWIRFAPLGMATTRHHEAEALVVLADGSVVVSGTRGLDEGDTGYVAKLTSAGVLDTGFATGGVYTIPDRRHCLGLAVDGAGLVVACHESAATSRFHVFRLAGTGALDAGFDSTLKQPPPGYSAALGGVAGGIPAHVLKLPDGRFIISGARIVNENAGPVEKFILLALTASGAVDTTFAVNGWYYDNDAEFGAGFRYARMAAWNGTSIDVVGRRLVDNRFEIILANFSTTGVRNSLVFDNPVSATGYFRVKALPDGKLLAAGTIMTFVAPSDDGQPAAQLSRYTASGALDASLGVGGHSDLPFDALGFAGLRDFAVLPSGKFVITGDFNKIGDPTFGYVGVGQALAAGGIDTAFNAAGTPGYSRLLIGAPFTRNLKVQADGKILVTGTSNSPSPNQFGVVRFNSDGTVDTTYGSAGLARTDFPSGTSPRHVALDAGGRAVVAGNAPGGTVGVARFTTAGALDSSFGTAGKVTHALPPGYTLTLPNKIEVLPDGKLLILLTANTVSEGAVGLLQLNADGTLDAGFGVNGFAMQSNGINAYGNAWGMVVHPNGRVAVVTSSKVAEDQPTRSTLMRFNPGGSLDTTFGAAGLRQYQASPEDLVLPGIDAFADGSLALAGSRGVGGFSQSVVMRTVADPSAVLALTTTTLGTSQNPATAGQSVTFTATITGGTGSPGGSVAFRNGANTIAGCGAASLAAGVATCATSSLPAGTHVITAQYTGDASRQGSTSSPLNQTINAAGASARRFDFHADLKADILWRQNSTGENYIYPMDGRTILASEGFIRSVPTNWAVAGVVDFDGDGKADILWRNTTTGENYLYFMDGRTIKPTEGFIRSVPTNWVVAGVADFDGDGKGDILWRNTTTGENYMYFMDGRIIKPTEGFIRSVPTSWVVAGVADFDGDGKGDILWRNTTTGENYMYFMDSRTIKPNEGFIRSVPTAWIVAGVGEFDGDGKSDVLWRNTATGENYLYFMDGRTIKPNEGFIRSVPTSWIAASVGDFDGDTKADILWRNTATGENYIYPMDGRTIKPTEGYIRSVSTAWSVASSK